MKMQSHPHLLALAMAIVAIVVSLAMLVHVIPSPAHVLARRIGAAMEVAPPEDVAFHLTQLEGLGADALPTLVVAMGSRRRDVSLGARQLIDAEFDGWRNLPPDVASRQVEHLANLLATDAAEFHPAAREHARQLAIRILEWPIDRNAVDRTRLLAACEIVLRAAGHVVPARLAIAPNPHPRNAEGADLETRDVWHARQLPNGGSLRNELPDQALEGTPPPLPFEPSPLPVVLPQVGVPRPRVAEDRSQSAEVSRSGDASVLLPQPSPRFEGQIPRATPRPANDARQPGHAPFEPSSLRKAPVATPSREQLRSAETIDVVKWLLVDEAVTIARDELTSRGFSEVQLRVARELIDPDPQVRLKLARSVPRIPGIDPRVWLLWLSHDVDPSIRRETAAILATSPDPALKARLRELESEETDESVLRVVRRALEQGDQRR